MPSLKQKVFSPLMDGSTDQSSADNILLLVLRCDQNGDDEKMHTKMSFMCVHKPQDVTAEGMFQLIQYGLQCLGIRSVTKETCKLVGIATDGAAVNVAGGVLRGLVDRELHVDRTFWMLCLTHGPELVL